MVDILLQQETNQIYGIDINTVALYFLAKATILSSWAMVPSIENDPSVTIILFRCV